MIKFGDNVVMLLSLLMKQLASMFMNNKYSYLVNLWLFHSFFVLSFFSIVN